MAWLLVLDSNEQAHYARKGTDRRAYLAHNAGVACEVRPLACGDMALLWRADGGGAEHAVALFERKAAADMVASIKDGRYASQAQRMEASGVPHLYWLLDDWTPAERGAAGADYERVESAVVHLSDGVSYPHTRVLRLALEDLALPRTLARVARYLHDALHAGGGLSDMPLHTVAQEAGARPRLDTQAVVWLEVLTIPRGMSRTSARAVAAAYPTAVSLLRALRRRRDSFVPAPPSGRKRKTTTADDHVDAMLADLPLPGGKRLGPAAARTLRETLVPDAAELAFVLP
jgi:hypothetical protein